MSQNMLHSSTLTRRQTAAALTMLGLGMSFSMRPTRAIAHGAQDDPLAGATIEQLSAGMPSGTPGQALVLLRVTMEPDTVLAPHSHPGPVALYVESGTFGTEFIEGSGTITQPAVSGTPAAATEAMAGDDVMMDAGASLFYDGAVHTMRNDGEDVLVLLVSALFDAAAPGFEWVEGATPAAAVNRMTG